MVGVLPTPSEEGSRHLWLGCLFPRAHQGQHFILDVIQLLPVGNIHNFFCSTFHLTADSALSVVEDSYSFMRVHRQRRKHSLMNKHPFPYFTAINKGCQCSHSKTSYALPLGFHLIMNHVCSACSSLLSPSSRSEDTEHHHMPGGSSSSAAILLPLPKLTWEMFERGRQPLPPTKEATHSFYSTAVIKSK